MKGLDSGVLLGILEGAPRAKELLRKMRGVEVATTEMNLLELASIAMRSCGRQRRSRLAALERLRHRLTVLPIDSRAIGAAVGRPTPPGRRLLPLAVAIAGAMEAAGCEEILTDDPRFPEADWSFRVRHVAI